MNDYIFQTPTKQEQLTELCCTPSTPRPKRQLLGTSAAFEFPEFLLMPGFDQNDESSRSSDEPHRFILKPRTMLAPAFYSYCEPPEKRMVQEEEQTLPPHVDAHYSFTPFTSMGSCSRRAQTIKRKNNSIHRILRATKRGTKKSRPSLFPSHRNPRRADSCDW
jgi:hypothetical protein